MKHRNPWPLGPLPEGFERVELQQLKDAGCEYKDPRDIVTIFEGKIAEFAGAPHAVAVDSCTNALFLCLKYCAGMVPNITIPAQTYLSVPMAIINAGYRVSFNSFEEWKGIYQLKPLKIWDSAARFRPGMYEGGMHCLSFQLKKRLPIGKGGMILCDNEQAADWFRQASFEGRHLDINQWDDEPDICGWNMYMTPEDAARGILLFDKLIDIKDWADATCWKDHPDLREKELFQRMRRKAHR